MDKFSIFPFFMGFSLYDMILFSSDQNTLIGRIGLVSGFVSLTVSLYYFYDRLVEIWEEIQNVKEKL